MRGSTSKERGREGREERGGEGRRGKERGRKGRGGEGKGHEPPTIWRKFTPMFFHNPNLTLTITLVVPLQVLQRGLTWLMLDYSVFSQMFLLATVIEELCGREMR